MQLNQRLPLILLVSFPLVGGCRLGSGQAMPMAASQSAAAPAAQPNQPDSRAPTERDPALHTSHTGMSGQGATAAEPSADQGDMDEKMAAEMKELGAQMKDMGARMQKKSPPMKKKGMAAKTPQPAAAMDPAMAMAMGAHMKEMGAKMQQQARAMKASGMAAKAKPPAAMSPTAPAKMMGMGDDMMGMGDQMMGMGGAMGTMDPKKMMGMGDDMMEMGSEMGAMCCMGKKKMKMPPKDPMNAMPPGQAPAAAPAAPPMQDM